MADVLDAIEALANACIGFCVSWAATVWLLPLWGLEPSAGEGFSITLTFFVLSFARAYALRVVFRRMGASA